MAYIDLNLPDDLNQFVELQVQAGSFRGASDYILALIASAKHGGGRMEALLVEGLDSGEPMRLDDELRASIRRQVADSLAE